MLFCTEDISSSLLCSSIFVPSSGFNGKHFVCLSEFDLKGLHQKHHLPNGNS